MAAAPVLFSLEEYFIDGKLQERNLGEYDHGKIQGWIFQIFNLNGKTWGTDPVVEQRIQVAPNRVRICDVAILRANAPREKVTITPPLICVEVLSPEDRLSRAKLVLADYLAMGVKHIWLIDPIRRSVSTFDAYGLHDADPANLTVPGTSIQVDLTETFAALD